MIKCKHDDMPYDGCECLSEDGDCLSEEFYVRKCEYCDGTGTLSYNPNLNPNNFLAIAIAKCPHCHGIGSDDSREIGCVFDDRSKEVRGEGGESKG